MRSYCDLGHVRRSCAGGVRNTGVSMSGHWRFCVTAFILAAGIPTSPASSNPLTDLFNPAPKEAATPARAEDAPAPAPAREACLPQPGRSTAPGQHWVYHLNGHRRCWFQASEATVSAKKQIRHHFARRPAVAPEEDEAAPRKKTVLDARAQMFSAAPAGGRQSAAAKTIGACINISTRKPTTRGNCDDETRMCGMREL